MRRVKEIIDNNLIKTWLNKLLFPVNCLGCGYEGDWICTKCLSGISVSRLEQCVICGQFASTGLCQKCQKGTKLDGVISLYAYREPAIKKLVKEVKYRHNFDGFNAFSNNIAHEICQRLPNLDFVATFVPLEAVHQADRGFNQAEVLAYKIFNNTLLVENIFIKNRATSAQASLDKKERKDNLKKAFAIKTKVSITKKLAVKKTAMSLPKNLILVDDVITTGATLSELAKLARKNGCKNIWAVTVAHG